MGLSFHYSGRFNPEKSLKEMVDEVTDICNTFKWKYHIFTPMLFMAYSLHLPNVNRLH